MRIESQVIPTHRIISSQEPGLERQEDTVQVEVPEPVGQNPALQAFLGESSFEPAIEKAQRKEAAPPESNENVYLGSGGVDPNLDKLIADNIGYWRHDAR
jgi:hypothetical protein